MLRGVGERVLAAPDVPLAPWCDDGEIGGEGGVGELEADLVVALTSAAVREGVRADLVGDLDLPLGNQWASHRSAKQVLTAVDGAGAEGGEDEVADVLLAEILDVALVRTRGDRFCLNAGELVTLADVGGDTDDLGPRESLLEPGDYDGCIESSRVGEGDLLGCMGHGSLSLQDYTIRVNK